MAVQTNSEHKSDLLIDARNVILKASVLFLLINLVFAVTTPLPFFGRFSFYNKLFPGRLRLPYGDNPQQSYNLSLFNLEAMFRSHELSGTPKSPDEYRVILIGDSSTWGFLLSPGETLSAQINAARYTLADGRQVRAYNLGYPVMSLTKDLLILDRAMTYEPDLVIWPLTLESFPKDKQLFPPLLQNNPRTVNQLMDTYALDLDVPDSSLVEDSVWEQTIVGQRRNLADLIRLQLYGVMWAATGIDHFIPPDYTPRMDDLPGDLDFHELAPPALSPEDLAFEVLAAGLTIAGDIPVLIVNEPMFISAGENSDIRYNFFYPRWAYDDYRLLLTEWTAERNVPYLDLWDTIPAAEFTNSAVHMTARGTAQLAEHLGMAAVQIGNDRSP